MFIKGIWKPDRRKRTLWTIAAGLGIVTLSTVAVFFYKQSQDLKNKSGSENTATTQRVVKEVSQLYFLPDQEEPTVARIQDKEKLKSQAFFNSAENGDYLLVYADAKLALIYRESENKLVNVGPVTADSKPQSNGNVAGEHTENQ